MKQTRVVLLTLMAILAAVYFLPAIFSQPALTSLKMIEVKVYRVEGDKEKYVGTAGFQFKPDYQGTENSVAFDDIRVELSVRDRDPATVMAHPTARAPAPSAGGSPLVDRSPGPG